MSRMQLRLHGTRGRDVLRKHPDALRRLRRQGWFEHVDQGLVFPTGRAPFK